MQQQWQHQLLLIKSLLDWLEPIHCQVLPWSLFTISSPHRLSRWVLATLLQMRKRRTRKVAKPSQGETVYKMHKTPVCFFFFFLIYLFLAVLGLRFCAKAFSSCGEQGPLFISVRGPLTITASLVVEHRLQTRWLSNCGSRA